ncbi:winged helix-turn-helix domain-containing protein [Pengzhenrongella frigida]|uniref:Winged helix-turn-helix domain-containing protein n=1 Tax=Pengzhenrongella frigida TaxID=1259133 RepID=A0A4Q5MX47_9MICO|nr:crosslink repair DNA glycosylase YcaQ family protein [Cellulomonas sp. HLT2-17]RYV50180.1 winged helix-turn-helix domain-containing protein [Cellulomonas sp. HLT2-17]
MLTSRPVDVLSLSQARRVALGAQGLDRRRPEPGTVITPRHLRQVVDRTGLLQIDSVNVLARAHLMPVYSRLGAYDPALLDRAAGTAPRSLVEYWGHMASYVPPSTYRLLEWRQRAYRTEAWGAISGVELAHSGVVAEIRTLIAERGPMTASEVHQFYESDHPRVRTDWGWNWTVAKRALEFLFFTGEVTSARRTASFERCYDLTERVLPPAVLAAPPIADDDAIRALVEISARAHGVGTVRCLADYFRLRLTPARRAIDELVEQGVLRPVTVRGWDRVAYLHTGARHPRRASARTLLSPFDPLVFERRRLEELFAMHYRIEIYVPAAQRVHGYYVLPFLLGERIAARVDLKADRAAAVLRVVGAFAEDGAPAETPHELAAELRELAGWLALDDIEVADPRRGDLAASLAAALATV